MNKTVITLLLLGLVVAALAGEAAKDKLEKMRMKKERFLAKKERMHLDKVKEGVMGMGAVAGDKRREMFSKDINSLRAQMAAGEITAEDFKRALRQLKDQDKRARTEGMSSRKEAARKTDESRNKRSTKDVRTRKAKSAYKNKAVKARRGE